MNNHNFSMMNVNLLALLAISAFAANSMLCRLALSEQLIDPASFSAIRLISGAFLLTLYIRINRNGNEVVATNLWSSLSLLVYVVCFSFAYVHLSSGVGAFILFTTVQICFIAAGLFKGEKVSRWEVMGLILAISGFLFMMVPSLEKPSFPGMMLMLAAGLAAAVFSFFGKQVSDPLAATARNFGVTVPFAIGLFLWAAVGAQHLTVPGVILAVFSGAYASGVGYVLWYGLLPRISYFQAASSQFGVPVLTAILGILLLGERVSWNFAVAIVLILTGLGLSIFLAPSSQKKAVRIQQ